MQKCLIITDITKYAEKVQTNKMLNFIDNYEMVLIDIGLLDYVNSIVTDKIKVASMVSYYLGSNTLKIKKKELEYLKDYQIKYIFYFFDLSYLKFNEDSKIKKELNFVKTFLDNIYFNIFIPTNIMSEDEIRRFFKILNTLNLKEITIGNLFGDMNYSLSHELAKLKNNYDTFNLSVIVDNEFSFLKNSELSENKNLDKLIVKF